jgi:S-adenosylmethionine/arginine decarboxylase-like enzyme
MSDHFGYHTMFDMSNCNRAQISSRENIYNYVKTLITRIDMIAVGEPIIEMLCVGDPKVGYSMMQLISTSNITGHFMEISGEVYLDVFSCKPYDIKVAEDCAREFFTPEKVRVNFITRHAD